MGAELHPHSPFVRIRPLQLSVFSKLGIFKGKKVGIFGGDSTDESEVAIVEAALKKLHVDVIQTAIDAAPEGDDPAAYAQVAVISSRFQSTGVNEVVAVGDGSATWPDGLNGQPEQLQPAVGGHQLSGPQRLS